MITREHLKVLPELKRLITTYLAGVGNRTGKDQEEDQDLLVGLGELQEVLDESESDGEMAFAWRTKAFEDSFTRMKDLRSFRTPMNQEERGD